MKKMILFLIAALLPAAVSAQEYELYVGEGRPLYDAYPANLDIAQNESFFVFSYNPESYTAYVYNMNHMGYIIVSSQTGRLIKGNMIPDLNREDIAKKRETYIDFIRKYEKTPVEGKDKEIGALDETQPSFPVGREAFRAFRSSNLKYPQEARQKGIQGRVVVSFIVGKDGSLSHFKVIKSVEPSIDAEALRIMKLMPKWIPATRNGKPMECRYNVPVSFRLHQ